ncbi:diacylglycerol kinase family protein [Aequorivita echinoideorum]|uniref:Diacylglycerol kinase family protein n=1 Tax=Aequorivita echinoideorum TaxID=1549647 RepID=A0ABS5S6E5_9FLAO|nr:diacylglycerol kinase family protein [Aequorivita echinoideorum]MBT0608009.1 diacylglycerol kinase family protein [Aequorivita echinoideorum]
MWNTFLGKRLKGCAFALKGAWLLLSTEASIQVQFVIAILVTIAGFYFNISATEWMFQIFAIGLIMSIEGLNTAAEEIADFVHPDFHNKIGFIKDIAAGAVFFAAVTAVIIGCIIYIPKL